MNGNEAGTVEYSTELTFNSNLPNLIVLNVAFYMRLIWQFDSAHVKFDVLTRPNINFISDFIGSSYCSKVQTNAMKLKT